MSPTERARQIDREEFDAECAAIRQRAYMMLGVQPPRDAHIDRWIKRKEPKGGIKPAYRTKVDKAISSSRRVRAANAKLYSAFGKTHSLKEWATETGLSSNTIRNRLNLGWTIEQALTLVPQKGVRPGVVDNLPPLRGTGAGSTAQETPNLSFSGIEA